MVLSSEKLCVSKKKNICEISYVHTRERVANMHSMLECKIMAITEE